MHAMKILHVCKGAPEKLPGKSYKTGIFKMPVRAGVMIDVNGLVGDAILNGKHHGGLDQAVYVLGSVDLDGWSDNLGRVITPGTFGENLVVDTIDSRAIAVGDRFETDDVLLEVTSVRIPCATLSVRMEDPHFARRFLGVARPGFYCRVLKEGVVTAGDAVRYIPFAGDRVGVCELLATSGKRLSQADRRRYLASPIHQKLRQRLDAQDG